MKKTCSKCCKTKDIHQFVKDNRRKDGRGSRCKNCHSNLYYVPHPWKSQPLQPDDPKTCTKCNQTKPAKEFDHRKEDRSGYHSHCRECRREISQNWKKKNKEHLKEYRKQYQKDHSDVAQRWWKNNKDKAAEYTKRYYSSKRGKLYNRNSQAKRRTLEENGEVTVDYLEYLFANQNHCAYCKKPFNSIKKPTIDHIVPISKGGNHTPENITLACQSCNSSKNNRIITT